MSSNVLYPVAKVYVVELVSVELVWTFTVNVDVSANSLGIINLWSASALSAVYLKVVKVPSIISRLENV